MFAPFFALGRLAEIMQNTAPTNARNAERSRPGEPHESDPRLRRLSGRPRRGVPNPSRAAGILPGMLAPTSVAAVARAANPSRRRRREFADRLPAPHGSPAASHRPEPVAAPGAE